MRRAEFLRLTGLTVDNLKNLVRRDCIPFGGEREDGSVPPYDYRQAYATKLALRLGAYLDLKQAKEIVENYLDVFIATFGPALVAGKPIFFGYGRHFGDTGGDVYRPDVGLVSGPLQGLTESVIVDDETGRFAHFELIPLGQQKAALTEVVLIDATHELADFRRDNADHPLTTSWIIGEDSAR